MEGGGKKTGGARVETDRPVRCRESTSFNNSRSEDREEELGSVF